MNQFSINFKPSVEKDLRRLSQEVADRMLATLDDLKFAPLPRQAIKLANTEGLYRLRVGEYRIVYEIDTEALQITVHYIRHRSKVYRNL